MKNANILLLFFSGSLVFAFNCSETGAPPNGELLAHQHCASCHQFVAPDALPQEIWASGILPNMGYRLGIIDDKSAYDSLFLQGLDKSTANERGIYPQDPQLSDEEWDAIKGFYLGNSPIQATPNSKVDTLSVTDRFEVKRSAYTRRPPLTTMVQIVEGTESVILADGKSNVNALIFLDGDLEKEEQVPIAQNPIQFFPYDDGMAMLSSGKNIYPNDHQQGSFEKIYRSHPGKSFDRSSILADKLRRPVHVNEVDLDRDGNSEWIICEFGHNLGHVSMYSDQFSQSKVILDLPGALKSVSFDLNGDGWKDVLILVSQGREGIVYLHNSEGVLEPPVYLLEFSPLMGSTYFDLVDFDMDGDLDIIYTCGDNADKSPVLKSHHGIYIFLQGENQTFVKDFFYPMPGAYKALALNLDEDTDLEIAAISFFPDYASLALPFVLLDKVDSNYVATTISDPNQGRWMVMDAGDFEGDGDIDIVLGSFVRFYPSGDQSGLFQRWIESSPAALLLKNKTHH